MEDGTSADGGALTVKDLWEFLHDTDLPDHAEVLVVPGTRNVRDTNDGTELPVTELSGVIGIGHPSKLIFHLE